jgi:uncharacterized protein (DUF1778 family)
MATVTRNDARIDFRLPAPLKEDIERAAAYLGQSLSDFAVGVLSQSAREVIHRQDVTELSNRDRDIFLAMLDDDDARPNAALRKAAERYERQVG